MDRLAALISSKKSTDRVLVCSKDIYNQIIHSIPEKLLLDGGEVTYHGLEVRLDESKEAGYAEIC